MGVAQLDRAFGYGPKGRGFESSRPRYIFLENKKEKHSGFLECFLYLPFEKICSSTGNFLDLKST